MARLPWSALVAGLLLGATSTLAAQQPTQSATVDKGIVQGAFMLECDDEQACKDIARAVADKGGSIRQNLTSTSFHGLSVQLPASKNGKDAPEAFLAEAKGVKDWEPVHMLQYSYEKQNKESAGEDADGKQRGKPRGGKKEQMPGNTNQSNAKKDQKQEQPKLRSRDSSQGDERIPNPWNHVMTQIEKLHEEGFTGSGIKIAIVDTGVNYKLPALGGCFGKGCRVTHGANFYGDGEAGDPIDCHGHGTEVATILAGYDEKLRFIGAAPNATIMSYKVIGCQAEGDLPEDNVVKAWLQAEADGAQIITSSTGFQSQNWGQKFAARIVDDIVSRGVPCIVPIGNIQDRGLFNILNPSSARGAIAVNSVGKRSGLNDVGLYRLGNDPKTSELFLELKNLDGHGGDLKKRLLHDIDADYGDKPGDDLTGAPWTRLPIPELPKDDCNVSPRAKTTNGTEGQASFEQDLVDRVVLVRQSPYTKGCSFYSRLQNAVNRGATHVLVWDNDEEQTSLLWTGPKELRVIAFANGKDVRPLSQALAAGTSVNIQFKGARPAEPKVGSLSALGPTWDLDLKPEIMAPGHHVPVVGSSGRPKTDVGTSFAAPLVAGAVALVAEARRTFDPKILKDLVMGTAKPQGDRAEDGGKIWAVAQQGGGLLQAWEAAHATTLIQPAKLAFNDTDHRVSSISLRVTNKGKKQVKYQIFVQDAPTIHSLRHNTMTPGSGDHVEGQAAVKMSKSLLTLEAGQSDTVEVSATDPKGVDPSLLPIWSGWVNFQGSDGKNQSIPFLGVAGSLRSTKIFSPRNEKPWNEKYTFTFAMVVDGKQDPEPLEVIEYNVKTLVGSPMIRADIVPLDVCASTAPPKSIRRALAGRAAGVAPEPSKNCVPASLIKEEINGYKSISQVPGYPKLWTNHHDSSDSKSFQWTGALTAGGYAPAGRYKIVIQALSIMGDRANKEHWQILELPEFSIIYLGDEGTLPDEPF